MHHYKQITTWSARNKFFLSNSNTSWADKEMIRNYSYTKIKRKIILLIRRKLAMKQNKGKYEKAIIRCNGKKKSFTQFCLLKSNKTLRGNSQRKECHSRTQTVFIELIGN